MRIGDVGEKRVGMGEVRSEMDGRRNGSNRCYGQLSLLQSGEGIKS